jgi:hypothetical protein
VSPRGPFFSLHRLSHETGLELLGAETVAWAQRLVTERHYLHKPVDARCIVEGYAVWMFNRPIAALLVGRPQATRCGEWYGSVEDARVGRCEVTRWQVLNLARVWIDPCVQPGGEFHDPEMLPGFIDRRGTFRSILGSLLLQRLADQVAFDYLVSRPPCFLEEPYELRWLLSYCDTRLHRGVIYHAAGWQLYRTNENGIQTWRTPLRPLTAEEDAEVRGIAAVHPRSIQHRFRRAQLALPLEEVA